MFEDKEVFFYLPDAAVDRIQHIILSRSTFFEAGLLSKVRSRIPPASTILDVGANISNHTVFFATFCDATNVIAFEPMKLAYRIVSRNVELNKLTNVRVVNAALGETAGSASLGDWLPITRA